MIHKYVSIDIIFVNMQDKRYRMPGTCVLTSAVIYVHIYMYI